MNLDAATVAAILAMAVVTYGCRAGGFFVVRRLTPGPRLRTMLDTLPGALFVAYVVPALAAGGLPQWVGAATTLGIMVATRRLVAAVLGGTLATYLVWSLA